MHQQTSMPDIYAANTQFQYSLYRLGKQHITLVSSHSLWVIYRGTYLADTVYAKFLIIV